MAPSAGQFPRFLEFELVQRTCATRPSLSIHFFVQITIVHKKCKVLNCSILQLLCFINSTQFFGLVPIEFDFDPGYAFHPQAYAKVRAKGWSRVGVAEVGSAATQIVRSSVSNGTSNPYMYLSKEV